MTSPPTVPVTWLAAAPAVDGVVTASPWRELPWLGPFARHDGSVATLATRACVAADATHLYVAFDVADPYIWANLTEPDAPIYNEEVVEVFLDPAGDGRRYHEIEVSPRNVVLDGINTWRDGQLDWDPAWGCDGLRTAVVVDGRLAGAAVDRGWSATLAIPFAGLGVAPPRPGDSWRANLYRIDRPADGEAEFSALSPTQAPGQPAFFNVPDRFATLAF